MCIPPISDVYRPILFSSVSVVIIIYPDLIDIEVEATDLIHSLDYHIRFNFQKVHRPKTYQSRLHILPIKNIGNLTEFWKCVPSPLKIKLS